MICPTCSDPMRLLLFTYSCDTCVNQNRIEVLMDHPAGPRVLCPIDDPGLVEDSLPDGWCVGWSWCMSQPEDRQRDGRWLLALYTLEEMRSPPQVEIEILEC